MIGELQSAVPVVGAPELDGEITGGTLVLAATLMTAPAVIGTVLETVILLWTDRAGRRPVLVASLLLMALTTVVAATTRSPVVLAVALGVWNTATGVAGGIGEAAIVTTGDPDRAMTRWGLGGAIGDLLAPALLGSILAAGGSWREAMFVTAALPLLDAVLVAFGPPLTTGGDDDEEQEPLGVALRSALADRTLLAWLLAATSCTLLDEILVALAALRLEALGAGFGLRALELGALGVGMAVGLALTERWQQPREVLVGSCVWTVAAFAGWIAAGVSPIGVVFAGLLGMGIAPMWPLAKAAAFARVPGRPGLVNALDRVLSPLELGAPLVVGFVADRYGLVVALVTLLIQPALVAAVALHTRRPR